MLSRGAAVAPLAAAALPAIPIGLFDAISPPTVQSQVVGLTYLGAGIVAAACGWALLAGRGPGQPIALLGASAALYVWVTLALYSLAVRPALTAVAGILALASLAAGLKLTRAHRGTGKGFWSLVSVRVTAASVSALIAAAQLWYTSVYLPANVEVGIAFSVTAGAPQKISRGLRLVPLEVGVQNQSSGGAVALTSIVTVTGIRYAGGRGRMWRGEPDVLARELQIGSGNVRSEQDLNVSFTPIRRRRLLAVARAVGDGRIMFPGVANSTRMASRRRRRSTRLRSGSRSTMPATRGCSWRGSIRRAGSRDRMRGRSTPASRTARRTCSRCESSVRACSSEPPAATRRSSPTGAWSRVASARSRSSRRRRRRRSPPVRAGPRASSPSTRDRIRAARTG
jgi:hypothetical protein